jgi:glutamate synthase (NADPH/NADH) small chain
MGKPTGFMEWPRTPPPKRDKHGRLADSREFTAPLGTEGAVKQAGRCMDCGVPTCHQGCPLGNIIPDFNDHVFHDRWRAAWASLSSTNNFPEFTGRLCPAPCEAACVLAINTEPVAIEYLEKEIIERAFFEGWVQPRPPSVRTGKHVAVVGSGPAGLAAAAQLNQAGHTVTVYERDDKLGGLLRYGIPDFKLEKQIIDRRLAVLTAEGINFRTGVDVGGSLTWKQLAAEHDATLIAIGARRPRELEVHNRNLSGVVQAMEFLEGQNRVVDGGKATTVSAAGKRVVILGGGDTGSDCLGTALRQGAANVMQVELLPAPPSHRSTGNPWPQWPMIFRTSSSQEEGGTRHFAMLTRDLEGVDGKLVALHAVEVELENGALRELPGTETRIEVDLLLLAMGFVGPDASTLCEQLQLALDGRGNVKVDSRFATSAPGVYCAGDASRGASLIVWAIADGREAAREMDAFLVGQPSLLQTRGRDVPFGGR